MADDHLSTDRRPGNRLLAALSAGPYGRLKPYLRTVELSPRQLIVYATQPIRSVLFPNGGVFSLMTPLSGGTTVEVASVGDEGMLGVEAFFEAAPRAMTDVRLQVPVSHTTAEELDARIFKGEVERHEQLFVLVQRYLRVLLAAAVQSSACNATHPLHERCCRWLLEAHDRIHAPRLHVTQEFLAATLGARRATITGIARDLQERGLIRYSRGVVRILDRAGLEERACECYCTVRRLAATDQGA